MGKEIDFACEKEKKEEPTDPGKLCIKWIFTSVAEWSFI